jgi:2-amino-4-hydroxy-6-hydroxymethyldihydropteridine diphosphokinase
VRVAPTVSVAIALGSNLGDRHRYLQDALASLAPAIQDLHVSTFHDTDPVGILEQPRFLNAAAVGITGLTAQALIDRLLEVERCFGRVRPYAGAPRTLDLDLILYGDAVIDEPGLSVPHPRFRDRTFVLEPLVEIAADWIDPVTGCTVGELCRQLGDRGPS